MYLCFLFSSALTKYWLTLNAFLLGEAALCHHMQHRIWAFMRSYWIWWCVCKMVRLRPGYMRSESLGSQICIQKKKRKSNALSPWTNSILWWAKKPIEMCFVSHVGTVEHKFPDKLVDVCVQNWFCDKKMIIDELRDNRQLVLDL